MRFDKKGELGFPEAIMAAMIVTIVLTMYMGLFVLNAADDNEGPDVNVDHRIFNEMTLENGEITGDIETPLISEMERHGFRGISFLCEIPGEFGFESKRVIVGNMDGKISSERFLLTLGSSDGRMLPAVVEVAVCV
jgi:hypothetical protein